MIRGSLVFFLLLTLSAAAFAQDEGLEQMVDYKVNKMQKELHLTDGQALAVRPLIKDYLVKREEISQQTAGQGIVDHVAVKETLRALKEKTDEKLSKILTPQQMKKWIDKENLMAALNPDSFGGGMDEGMSLSSTGVNFNF